MLILSLVDRECMAQRSMLLGYSALQIGRMSFMQVHRGAVANKDSQV